MAVGWIKEKWMLGRFFVQVGLTLVQAAYMYWVSKRETGSQMTYYLTALHLFTQVRNFGNETAAQVFVLILRRRYRLHWLRARIEEQGAV